MKKYFLLALLFLLGACWVNLQAQSDKENDKNNKDEKETIDSFHLDDLGLGEDASREDSSNEVIIDLTFDNWLNLPEGVVAKWYSRGIGYYGMYDVPVIKKHFSIAIGSGFANSNVYYNGVISKTYNGATTMTPIPNEVFNSDSVKVFIDTPKRNKLSTTYFDVPIEFRLRSRNTIKHKGLRLAVGAKVGYCLDARTKYWGDDLNGTGDEVYIVNRLLPNINRLRYGVTGNLGLGPINLFGYYSLSTLFQNDKGPGIQPFSVGLRISWFTKDGTSDKARPWKNKTDKDTNM